MNQIFVYIILGGISMIVFSGVYTHFSGSLELEKSSQYDKNEIEKNRASEYIKLIEIMNDPLRIDLINLGEDEIVIRKLFIDGVVDDSYVIDNISSDIIKQNEIIRITPSITSGDTILLISENYKRFELG